MSRTKSTILNFSWAIVGQILGLIISFISRIFFIKTLGSEYLGLNGLFTNILTVLSLAELGVGNAITFSLYKPLSETDEYKCKMLMQLYKKIYTIIGIFILLVGMSLTPVLHLFIKDMPQIANISLIYILFVINTAISYFYSYKRNLIIADQNRYIATIYRYSFYFVLNICQIFYLVLFRDYIGFLILQIISTFMENICVSRKANKMYPYLKEKEKIPLEPTVKNDIIKNTKAMMMHKIGGVVVTSTDNIILSKFVGLIEVGLYSNYSLVLSALNTVFGQIYNSLTASIGNLCASSKKDKQYDIFKKINFLTYWIFSFSSVCLICLFSKFIKLWIGSEFILNFPIVIVLVVNFYVSGLRKSVLTFRDATGLFYVDRWKCILESFINLVASITLAVKYGMLGVFLGTFISSVTTCVWMEPYVLYKYGFDKKISEYFIDYLKKIIITISMVIVTYYLCGLYKGNIYITFIINCIICGIVPNLILFIIYRKTEEFKYFYDKIFSKILKKLHLSK